MKKLGIIVDSFSCLSAKQAEEKGFKFLPLQIEIDGVLYEDDFDDNLELLHKISTATKITTSLPKLEKMQKIIKDASKEYDEVIYLGLSQHLSNTFSQASSIATECQNVFVMENHLVGNQIVRTVEHFKKMYENGATINDLFTKLNDINETSKTFIVPYKLDFLLKGGRLSGIKKFLLSKFKVYPILNYNEEGKVKSIAIKQNFKNAVYKAFDLVNEYIDELKSYAKDIRIFVDLVTGISDEVNKFITSDEFPKTSSIVTTPSLIAAHTGPDAFAISLMLDLDK
ncbi:DegV family protein with EDD domain [Mycoplasmopsis mustelae]|uniref:DegV family protein with EDD domain n=1 Tax=Mycoplasmopsis mustelae TaxID=171289 RepID=A0A4R7UEI7_9BACT|nr:DegV family protein [Mycoplasmopsis mustelae]TDV24283.1 DegV family protein with EDD domain [Mycoplasmopsis mustelae]